METNHPAALKERNTQYWRSVRRLTLALAAVWLIVTLGVIFFARELSTLTILGWPFSFYMAAQGSVLIYVAIIGIHAWRMQTLDARHAARSADGQ